MKSGNRGVMFILKCKNAREASNGSFSCILTMNLKQINAWRVVSYRLFRLHICRLTFFQFFHNLRITVIKFI